MHKLIPCLLAVVLCGCATTLQEKYADQSTSQLKLRYTQDIEYLNGEKKDWEIKWGPQPLFASDPRADRIKEKENLEQELLRRYQAGDQEAHLAVFDQ